MNAIVDFFGTEGFMPHGMCLMWKPSVFWMHVVSDAVVALAYYSIPFALIFFARRRTDLAFPWIFYMIGAFILLCGATHAMGIWTMWQPDYGVDALLKLATAIVSIGTAWTTWRLMPTLLALPSTATLRQLNQQLIREVDERQAAETAMRRMNEGLEARVRERTAALEDANTQLRTALNVNQRIFESSRDIILTLDANGTIASISPGCMTAWNYSPDELVGKRLLDLVAASDRTQTEAQIRAVRGGNPTNNFQNHIFCRNSTTVVMLWSAVWSDVDQRLYAVGRDLTERLQMEEKLRRTQQLEAIGHLTGGVAHDFNNLLMVILGNAEMLSEELEGDPRLKGFADMTVTAAERGAELTQRLLAFARRQVLAPRVVDANTLLGNMEALLRRSIGEHVEIDMVRSANLWCIEVDAGQVDAALLNLALNARDAMPEGGRLTIETANARLDADYVAQQPDAKAGPYVMISVSDTGSGMDADTLARAFEPFFTTKEVGKGTGLGLSMVYGFVQQSGGHIRITSEVGQGTTVKMYFPRVEGRAVEEDGAPEAAAVSGRETILVVEDDALVRAHVARQLTDLGYRVLTAPDGQAAIGILRYNPEIDLLFTDVVMPGGMNGRQLATEVRALRPDLPVLFTSGYPENAIVTQGRLEPGLHILVKPYRKRELMTKVRELLDDHAIARR